MFTSTSGEVADGSFYPSWISSSEPLEARCKRLGDRGLAISIPAGVGYIRDCRWRCVFTSNIDPTPRRLLQVANRRSVLEKFQRADNPEASVLPLFRLFGSTDRQELQELPPGDKDALRQQRATAQEMMRPLAELTTPMGRLFIEGWNPDEDWLRPRDLAPVLTGLGPNQVLIFGLDEVGRRTLRKDDDFGDLVAEGIVQLVPYTLAEMLEYISETGQYDFIDPVLKAADERVLQVVDKTPREVRPAKTDQLRQLVVSQQEWRTFNETFEVLLPIALTRPFLGTSDERYKAFRRFLAHSPDSQLDTIRHFAFRRPVLDRSIKPMVEQLLSEASPQDYVVLITGQSGVGKTVLLSLLAVDLREAGIPVVLVRRGVVPPNLNQLDKFAQRLEMVTKVPIVVIYDGLHEESEYTGVAHFLGSRGRKVLIIGSAHGPEEQQGPRDPSRRRQASRQRGKATRIRRITVPVKLDNGERVQLMAYLGSFLPDDLGSFERLLEGGYNNFFAVLYRLLDVARQRLRDGLIHEIEIAAERFHHCVEEAVADNGPDYSGMTAMQYALREALGDRMLTMRAEDNGAASDTVTQIEAGALKMVNAVLVASGLGVDVPQSIALNLLPRQEWYRAYRQALESFHVLDAKYVAADYCILLARHPIEAKIWCEQHIRERREQFALIREMVLQLRSSQVNDDRSPELNFVVQLLRAIGPQGRTANRMPDRYGDIADLVNELRGHHRQDLHPRLLLIESNAAREWVQVQQRPYEEKLRRGETNDLDFLRRQVHSWLELLRRAEQSLNDAIDAICGPQPYTRLTGGARRMMAVLYTERACVLGAQQRSLKFLVQASSIKAEDNVRQMDECLDRAIDAWRRARSFQEGNYQALDAACWILRDRLEVAGVEKGREAQLLAEWSEIIEQYRAQELSSDEEEKFYTREADFTRALGDVARFEAVMERMSAQGMNSVHTLRARYVAQEQDTSAARRYLEEKCSSILETDRAVLLLYYRLWWETETGYSTYFDHDHMTLAFSSSQWDQLGRLARARLSLEGEQENCMSLFHLGWASLQTEQTMQSREAFQRLEMVSIDSFRRARSLAVVSHADGTAREFMGETRGRIVGNRGRAWIDELRLEIDYPVSDFSEVDSRAGRPIGPFHIALNFRGAFAQPLHRFPRPTET